VTFAAPMPANSPVKQAIPFSFFPGKALPMQGKAGK
jgi:hypothetical protein